MDLRLLFKGTEVRNGDLFDVHPVSSVFVFVRAVFKVGFLDRTFFSELESKFFFNLVRKYHLTRPCRPSRVRTYS